MWSKGLGILREKMWNGFEERSKKKEQMKRWLWGQMKTISHNCSRLQTADILPQSTHQEVSS